MSSRVRLKSEWNLIKLCGSGSNDSADLLQIVGDHAPADPTLEAIFAVIETTIEIIAAFEHQDATFDTGMPLARSAEPGLFLTLATLLRFLARFRKHNPLDPSAFGFSFIIA